MGPSALEPIRPEDAWGGCELRAGDPEVEEHAEVYYVPYAIDAGWGLFDREDQILMAGVDLLLPNGHWTQQTPQSPVRYAEVTERAPETVYIYGGRLNAHYGHFLVDVLGRYWPRLAARGAPIKVLVHHQSPARFFARHDFARAALGTLGLTPDDVVAFDRPTRLAKVIVPWTSFRHQTYAHQVYAELCRRIGAGLLNGRRLRAGGRPVYLSKARLASGIRRFANEAAMERRLAAGGVEIVHPQMLPLAEQIALFAERPLVMGLAGSGFHTGAFAPTAARTVLLNPKPRINANFVLFDRLTGCDGRYFHVGGARLVDDGSAFARSFHIEQPERLADALLELV